MSPAITFVRMALPTRAINVNRATYIPILPIKSATLANFCYKGVPSSSSSNNFSSTSPVYVRGPTQQIIAVAFPRTTIESASNIGLGICDFACYKTISAPNAYFLIKSGSPVMFDSSHSISSPSIIKQSAGI